MPKGMVDKLYRLIAGEEWPEMERAITHLSGEMPAEVESMKDRKIRPMNGMERGLNRMLRPVAASTTPFGNITYDRRMIEDAMLQPEDVLAHELVHVRQIDRDGGPIQSMAKSLVGNTRMPYAQRDYEKEALDVEMRRMGRRKRMGDIPLR